MEFRTIVDVAKPGFEIQPCEEVLFVGSCFADEIGRRFQEEMFRATVNPYGVMYNPASILHTIERLFTVDGLQSTDGDTMTSVNRQPSTVNYTTVFLTLGTNHVYWLKETGEIVDNCQKRPQSLFTEEQLSVDECAEYLSRAIDILRQRNPRVNIVLTVSPIRYRKYGYHGSQLSKATLLLAVEKVISLHLQPSTLNLSYFPAYEIVNDELRDYRFYKEDMLHPSSQAVSYIWERLVDAYFSEAAKAFLSEWRPLRQALGHKPFNPDSPEYRHFMEQTQSRLTALKAKYPNLPEVIRGVDGII